MVCKLNHSKEQFRTTECRNYSKYDYKKLARDVENYDWSSIYAITNVNIACGFMKQALSSIIDQYAQSITKRVKGCRCPWLLHEMKNLMNTRDKILREARKRKKECDWLNYKRHKILCNNKVKQAKQKYHKDLLIKNSRNPKMFWKCIKEIFPTKEPIPVTAITNIDTDKNFKVANSLCSFFTNITRSLKTKAFKLRDFVWERPPTPDVPAKPFSLSYVSKIFVEKELKKRNVEKKPDGIILRQVSSKMQVILIQVH